MKRLDLNGVELRIGDMVMITTQGWQYADRQRYRMRRVSVLEYPPRPGVATGSDCIGVSTLWGNETVNAGSVVRLHASFGGWRSIDWVAGVSRRIPRKGDPDV